MNICVCDNYEKMSQKAASLMIEAINKNPEGLISLPGGDTPVGMINEFVSAVKQGQTDITRAKYVSLDEWVGLSAEDEGSCAHFNKKHLGSIMDSFAQLHIINGANANIEEERRNLDNFIAAHGPLTVSVLGIGLNGHIGFNEEGCSFTDLTTGAHIIPLSPTTKKVMSKYFKADQFKAQSSPEYGITQSLGQIMAAELVILIASGANKSDIIYRALKGPITEDIPASILQKHTNCYVVTDSDAGKAVI